MAAPNMNIDPNARERAPGFPPQFVSTPVPSALALFNQIPSAVQFNLYRVITEGIRHEENTYGYFSSAFVSIFSPTQQFQVSNLRVLRLPQKLISKSY
jgi:hypothetical protein